MSSLISSRTPEGRQFECPHCGLFDRIEPSVLTGDACCPACGHLIWFAIERDTLEPLEERRLPKSKGKRLRRGKALRLAESSPDFADFEGWLCREMMGPLGRARVFQILHWAAKNLDEEPWGPICREEFFVNLRGTLRMEAARRRRRRARLGPLRTLVHMVVRLGSRRLRDRDEVRNVAILGQDPLFDPWLDGG